MKAISPEEALAIYHAGPEAVVKTICELSAKLVELEERLKALEDQIAKNSRNSSKPPSSDGLKKPTPKSLRNSSGKPTGGQKGHEGYTLETVENPDHTVKHPVDECGHCGHSLKDVVAKDHERRQVFDLPSLQLEATEHQAEIKQCPHCGAENKGHFPEGVNGPAQYGQRMKALMVYLSTYQFIPYGRLQELLDDVFSCPLSQGTLVNANQECADHLAGVEEQIKEHILGSPVAHFDETGLRIKGKRFWLHVAATVDATAYLTHSKRGREAMEEMDILPQFKGIAVHDHWNPYFTYACDHALCNAHHLRELIFVKEQYHQSWAEEMIHCLLDIKASVDEKEPTVDRLTSQEITQFEQRYDQILERGFLENPLPPIPQNTRKKRGRKKQSEPRNLLDRLKQDKKETLAFMYDFGVPFDNNLAEKDIRMMKVQQKISGTFRSDNGADTFCRIRSYISTARKNTINILEAVQAAFRGSPFLPFLETVSINGP